MSESADWQDARPYSVGRLSAGEWWVTDDLNGTQVGWILLQEDGWAVTDMDMKVLSPAYRLLREARNVTGKFLKDAVEHSANPGA